VPGPNETALLRAFSESVDAAAAQTRGGRALITLLAGGRYGAGRLVEVRARPHVAADLIVIDLDVPLGQRPVVTDICRTERIAVAWSDEPRPPQVYPLREDFPEDVPHFNLAPRGEPRSLCLFDLAQDEILRILTPYVLLERTRRWLSETAYGRLHGDDQPLDPLFGASGWAVVLPSNPAAPVVFGVRQSDQSTCPVILMDAEQATRHGLGKTHNGFAVLMLETAALPHGRLRSLPRTMAELLEVYRELGADLTPDLRTQLQGWMATPYLFERPFLLVLTTPIERTPGVIGGTARKAFLGASTAQVLAEAMGAVLWGGDTLAPPLTPGPLNDAALSGIILGPMDIHQPFHRDLAQQASGIDSDPTRAIALIGAGALGSQVALTAARSGIGTWTIYDPDHLLPHNLARHGLSPRAVGATKAEATASAISRLLNDVGAATGVANDIRQVPDAPLQHADLVLDVSASVPVARWLALESGHDARTASVFFNPRGDALVILLEDAGRAVRLDQLEMAYYWTLVSTPALQRHLRAGVGIIPSGGCRNVSLKVPQSRAALLAGLSVQHLLERELPTAASIDIWSLDDDGVRRVQGDAIGFRELAIGDWAVFVSETVIDQIAAARDRAGRQETGGILVGSWDRQRRRGYVVGHYDAPPDSVQTATGFVRGMVGVYQTLEEVQDATAFNLDYVGEWHTHPLGHDSRPSTDDDRLLRWIGSVLAFSDVPALMAICGEDGLRLIVGQTELSAVAGREG
jgi:hypothetical protein